MKTYTIFILYFLVPIVSFSQTPSGDMLVRVYNINGTPSNTSVSGPLMGNLIYSQQADRMYHYNGTSWVSIDDQTLTLNNNSLSISGGNSVTLPSNSDNQTLTLNNNSLSISGGNSVTLPSGSDNQTLTLNNNSLSISGGNSVTLPNQTLAYSSSSGNLYISGGNHVTLPLASSNDGWSLTGNSLSDTDKFIGTTSNHDFNIRTNNTNRMIIKNDGDVIIDGNTSYGVFTIGTASTSSSTEVDILNNSYGTVTSSNVTDLQNLIDGNNSNAGWVGVGGNGNIFLNGNSMRRVIAVEIASQSYGVSTSWVLRGRVNSSSSWVTITSFTGPLTSGILWRHDFVNNTQYLDYHIEAITNNWSIEYCEINLIHLDLPSPLDFVVADDGNIGIGVTAPQHKLHVGGNIFATAVNTPDYVFEKYFEGESGLNKDYEFLELEEIERHIKKHKHLPGIPSAKDIEKQGGIFVNQATEQNLEKIEELYLHLIEMSKEIKVLKQQLGKATMN